MKRYLQRHGVALLCVLLISFFFTTSCKKEQEFKPEKIVEVEKVTLSEIRQWFNDNKTLLEGLKPIYWQGQQKEVDNKHYVRIPLSGTYVMIYFSKVDGALQVSGYKPKPEGELNGSFNGLMEQYDFNKGSFTAYELKQSKITQQLTNKSSQVQSQDKQTESIFGRILCWLKGGIYNNGCLEFVKEDLPPITDSNYAYPPEFVSNTFPDFVPAEPFGALKGGGGTGSAPTTTPPSHYGDPTWEPIDDGDIPITGPQSWEDYATFSYDEAVQVINSLKHPATGEGIELLLASCYEEGRMLDISMFNAIANTYQVGEYKLIPQYDKGGKLLFYSAFRNEQFGFEYIIKANSFDDFENSVEFYTERANKLFLTGPIPSLVQVASEIDAMIKMANEAGYVLYGYNEKDFIDYYTEFGDITNSSPVPEAYYKNGVGIDMRNAPIKGSSFTALGDQRNLKYFWDEMLKKKPEMFDADNVAKIRNSKAPEVNEQWIKYNPSHKNYMKEKLIHHHDKQGHMAYAIPQKVHLKWNRILHTLRKNGSLKALRNKANSFAMFTGFITFLTDMKTGNPDAWINWFGPQNVIGQIYYSPTQKVYFEIITKTEKKDASGKVIEAYVTYDTYSDVVWDADENRYMGALKITTITEYVDVINKKTKSWIYGNTWN